MEFISFSNNVISLHWEAVMTWPDGRRYVGQCSNQLVASISRWDLSMNSKIFGDIQTFFQVHNIFG